jgi:hypothetical protein
MTFAEIERVAQTVLSEQWGGMENDLVDELHLCGGI